MSRNIKRWGIPLISLAVLAAAGLYVFRWQSLRDFEQRCIKATDPVEREKIALAAVQFLINKGVPDSITQQINRSLDKENGAIDLAKDFFSDTSRVLNDSLFALYEMRMKDFLPLISQLRRSDSPDVVQQHFEKARSVSREIDKWSGFSYWTPLLNFLSKANDNDWRRWYSARVAADMSRSAMTTGKAGLAQFYAIAGLRSVSHLPDPRLELDLFLRLQNPLAEGRAAYGLALTFGKWITRKCMETRHYLRAAGMDFNLANQMIRTGRYDEAIERLQAVQNLSERWWWLRGMEHYRSNALERLAVAMFKIGEYQSTLDYLELFGKYAQNSREKALYYLGRGEVFEELGNYQIAEQEFLKSITAAKDIDPDNTWYAYLALGNLFLKYNLPEKSLHYLEQGKEYGDEKSIVNDERLSNFLFLLAQAYMQKSEWELSKAALAEADKLSQQVDSPRLQVNQLQAAATLYTNLKEYKKAATRLEQARLMCRSERLLLEELGVILKQTELALQTPPDSVDHAYPVEELSNVIDRLKENEEKPQLIRALALMIDAAYKAGETAEAERQAHLLLEQTEVLSKLYDQEERLVFFQHGIYKDIKTAIQLDIKLRKIETAYQKLDYIKGRALRKRLIGSSADRLSISNLRESLRADEAVVDYMLASDTLYVFIISRSKFQFLPIATNKSKLRSQVEEYVHLLKDNSIFQEEFEAENQQKRFTQLIALSNAIYNNLFFPIDRQLQSTNRLYIVPDEFLHALPFGTLATKTGEALRFLIEDKAIITLPGAWMLNTQPSEQGSQANDELFASIDLDLLGADNIVEHANTLFGEKAHVYTKWENETAFEDALVKGYYTYLFFAHAEANWNEPRTSYIEIPLGTPHRRERFSYQSIDTINWSKAGLVILAGCETVGSRIYLGAGHSGLQGAFLANGAKQVLATYWRVQAAHVADQIPYFLIAWHQNGDAMSALQDMQKKAITQLRNNLYYKYPYPQLWGAYILTGVKPASNKRANSFAKAN